MRCRIIALLLLAAAPALADAPPEELLRQKDETLARLAREKEALERRAAELEKVLTLTRNSLLARKKARLQELAADVAAQRQGMEEFDRYVRWMNENLAAYSRYVAAGSVAARCAKFLPIPYAGQASSFGKFVADGALSLGATSASIAKYLASSQEFVIRAAALPTAPVEEVSALSSFARERLLPDMREVRQKLAGASQVSTSSLSFLQSVEHYLGNAEEYVNRTKALLGREPKEEKGFLAESIQGLKVRGEAFNGRLRSFEEGVRRDEPLIASLETYDELMRETGVAK
ncbi:MAG TPA: hypothetical protein VNX25_02755 [Verrucomicrobiae bacterium]|nr:hypothetical protein [Verrucomicrobiae bacterium]